MAALAGLAVSMEHESRLIQAVPERPALTLNLRQDVTIVLLALWYEYDTQVRDHGAAQVTLSVEQLNQPSVANPRYHFGGCAPVAPPIR